MSDNSTTPGSSLSPPSTTSTSITTPGEHTTSGDNTSQQPHPDSYHLNYVLREFLRNLNEHNFDAAAGDYAHFIAPEFEGQHMYGPPDRSFQEHMDTFREKARLLPNLQIHILDTSVVIDDVKGTAECWAYTEGRNADSGLKLNATSLMLCRKEGGQWLCYKHHLMPGLNDIV